MKKIQYVSDIHLEKCNVMPKNLPIKLHDCENLILAGDIGYPGSKIYKDFLLYCTNTWKNVFIIYGNHEYYTGKDKLTMNSVDNLSINFPSNVYFMNNNVFYLYNDDNVTTTINKSIIETPIKIIGSVLWSNISDITAKSLNDYRNIYMYKDVLLQPNYTRYLFYINKEFLIKELKLEPNIKCIIVTHHATHPLCQGHFQGSRLQDGYGTYIPELFEQKNLIACINGHSHSNINILLNNGIKLLSNCMGYKYEKQTIVKYNPNAVLEINSVKIN